MLTRDFTELEVDNTDVAEVEKSVTKTESTVAAPVATVTQEDLDEFEKFKKMKQKFKADFAKFKMYSKRADELEAAEAEANHGHVNSPMTP